MKISEPVIERITDTPLFLKQFEQSLLISKEVRTKDIISVFPTVYIHNWKETDKYDVYIGETNNVFQRTRQHFETGSLDKESWQNKLKENSASLYIIGHEHFNKSLTLDVENRLMQYLISVPKVHKVHNLRGNPQSNYYPMEELDSIFSKIWRRLRKFDKDLFPKENVIRDSAIFKASPLHKLTPEQIEAQELIIDRVRKALENNSSSQLIFIEGEAGSGKTVLNSSTFYEICCLGEEKAFNNIKCNLLVNHDEQVVVYEQIAEKLGISERYGDVVTKPTKFINSHSPEEPVDVVFVDEAHLLWTQGKQAYRGDNQLNDIIKRARVTVVMFDENQILTTEQFWETKSLEEYKSKAKETDNYIVLKNQLRIQAGPEIIHWIDSFTKDCRLLPLPTQKSGYSIKVFSTPKELDDAITEKALSENSALSRLIATYDWNYSSKSKPSDGKYWEVSIGNWHKPWNRELEESLTKKEKKAIKDLAWAEQNHTINEVGSTFTIQGFDLNYAGVIIGPSVKYRNGKIVFDPNASANDKATRNRTLADGSKHQFGEELLKHELRVLMTRGVNGLYIYACDDELRKALIAFTK